MSLEEVQQWPKRNTVLRLANESWGEPCVRCFWNKFGCVVALFSCGLFLSSVDVHFLLVAAGGARPPVEQLWSPVSADLGSWAPLGRRANQRR